ncbi:MobF family relaxase [Kribbella sp. CA-293567]|uniref:MobF family relaxase n=1 Tax=Kribbella sp. CA-293567 TaxID=3002436 RepID=UPI0022DD5882|nr:MobF family relaxase [Kribbella sp. CA-293567]WBQ04353.1 relaxase domain-containing protein [Kribbella sp. CA-293567]
MDLVLTVHRLTAGEGFRYLLRHVASGDVDRHLTTPLTSYYAASGYPPGRWMGSGLSGLANGGPAPGTAVSERQMAALFGRAEDPMTKRPLGRPHPVYKSPTERIQQQVDALDSDLTGSARYEAIGQIRAAVMREKTKHAVAGYDLTFSPAKSVSALWATSDVGTQEQILAAHHDAVEQVLGLIEQHSILTRTGEQGIAQIQTKGLIGAAFDHWDTRAGDPQLHTHVVVANRVQGPDGAWRSIDGRVLFRSAVAMSEIHNVFLADNLNHRLGIGWELRQRGKRRNPAFELSVVPDELIEEFSARTEQIESNLAVLLEERSDGLPPPGRNEMYVLRQQATLMNRPPKHVARPLASLMQDWRRRAHHKVGKAALKAIQESLDLADDRPLAAADLSPATIDAYAAAVVIALQTKRATWTRWNLLAEAARQTRLVRMVSSAQRFAVLESIVERAEEQSINLVAPEVVTTPVRRSDGSSVFMIHNGQIFTSPVILGAESLLLELARDPSAPKISGLSDSGLSADKQIALRRITSSGRRVEALVGPAGTGKTSLLSVLTTGWISSNGEGSVIALAPSSAASAVLADAIGSPAENIAKWIYESTGLGAEERRNRIRQTDYAVQQAHQAGRRRRAQRLSEVVAALRAEQDRWRFRSGQLVIVDEASMAGTMELATLAREANSAGAKLLLVGDDAQLGAADTGGAFRLIARDTDAAELSDVWRFTNAWERDASLALRVGSLQVIDVYDDHKRLLAGTSDAMEDAAYRAWMTDTAAGKTSLLIAADNTTVARLNARARLDRIITGEVEPDGIVLHNTNQVGIGDRIVTRLNNRRLRYARHSFVQNGDQWTVVHRWPDGSLTVENAHHHQVTLPASYVQESVELAYATTAHRAQGSTVDTAHLLVTDRLTRALMYVGMTRGRDSNHAYVATHQSDNDLHEPRSEQTMQDVLEAVLENAGVELSAHEVIRQELDNATRLDRLVPIHEHLCQLDARNRFAPAIATCGLDRADLAALEASPAYGPLITALRRAEAADLDVPQVLRRAVHQSSLNNATDIAAVLHRRVERLTSRASRRTGHTPHLIAGLVTPATHVSDPTLIAPLRELEAQIAQRAVWLADQATATSQPWSESMSRELLLEIAAYRERYAIRSRSPLGDRPAPNALAQTRQRQRLSAPLETRPSAHVTDRGTSSNRDERLQSPPEPAR